MAKKPTITTIASGYYSRQALNNNFTALQDAFDNTVSRDGSTPNTMQSAIDLNNQDILNAKDVHTTNIILGGVNLNQSLTDSIAEAASFVAGAEAGATASAASAIEAAASVTSASAFSTSASGFATAASASSDLSLVYAGDAQASADAAAALVSGFGRYSIKSAAYTAVVGEEIGLDVSGGPFTITMPASKVAGDYVLFAIAAGDATVNNVTVAGNGSNINGDTTLTVDLAVSSFSLVYNGAEWRVV